MRSKRGGQLVVANSIARDRPGLPYGHPNESLDAASLWVYTCIMTQINKHRPPSPKRASVLHRSIDDALNAGFFKALADPTRLRLLACLAKCARSCSVSEVAECCSVDFSVVSRHLALLSRAGIVEAHKDGRTVFYQVRFQSFAASLRALADSIDECCPDQAGQCAGGACGNC